jgi:hypothetical protein
MHALAGRTGVKMLHIAGGIILAIIILGLLPYILRAVGWLLIVAVALVFAALVIAITIGTENGWLLTIGSAAALAVVWTFFKLKSTASEAGGRKRGSLA